MTKQHLITPPPRLVQKWIGLETVNADEYRLAVVAAQWGADQELEACCEWIEEECPGYEHFDQQLRTARRPKPPSLKQQALTALAAIEGDFNTVGDRADTIRRALEALPE